MCQGLSNPCPPHTSCFSSTSAPHHTAPRPIQVLTLPFLGWTRRCFPGREGRSLPVELPISRSAPHRQWGQKGTKASMTGGLGGPRWDVVFPEF